MQGCLMCHVFLTGMPGSGKSSIGKKAAKMLDLPFIDMDNMLAEIAGCPVTDIFHIYGEAAFRRMETGLLVSLADCAPSIVSTGGGTVIREENQRIMQGEGRIILLDRPLELIKSDIDLSTRPLLAAKGLGEVDRLYSERIGIYRSTADAVVENSGSYSAAVHLLWQAIECFMQG